MSLHLLYDIILQYYAITLYISSFIELHFTYFILLLEMDKLLRIYFFFYFFLKVRKPEKPEKIFSLKYDTYK